MVGASAQLAAFGAADQFLSANPQITYFKQIWRRYTQFAMESIEQSWLGDVDFGKRATISLSRAGDLVTEVWLQVKLPDLAELNHIANATASATEPVVYYARNTSQSTLKIDAYTCTGASNYVVSCKTAASPVVSVRLNTADLGVTVVLSHAASEPMVLVPFGPGSSAASAVEPTTEDDTTWVSSALTPGVAYAVCFGTNTTSRAAVVKLASTAASTVSFVVPEVDPGSDYAAQVSTVLANQPAASLSQTVLKVKWCNSVGHAMIASVEWELGGSRIDRHTAEHFDMWCELAESEEKRGGYSDMIGRYADYDINDDAKSSGAPRLVFVPLRFSFNTNPGNALPLLALQFQDCKLNFEFRPFLELIKTNVPVVNLQKELSMAQCKVFATYVFLSQDERLRFAQMPHEYLIEQLQSQVENVAAATNPEGGVVNRKVTLTLNHPIKEIMWVYHAATNIAKDPVGGNNWFDYNIPGHEQEEIFEDANIQMNGHDRFVKRPAKYFRLVVPWSHHTRCPSKRVHCYSFALHPESWQNPSGAANFSRIDSAHLNLTLNPHVAAGRLRIHAIGYNILRIAHGLSGLVFTN